VIDKARQLVPFLSRITSVGNGEIVHREIQSSEQVFVTANLVKIKNIEIHLEEFLLNWNTSVLLNRRVELVQKEEFTEKCMRNCKAVSHSSAMNVGSKAMNRS